VFSGIHSSAILLFPASEGAAVSNTHTGREGYMQIRLERETQDYIASKTDTNFETSVWSNSIASTSTWFA